MVESISENRPYQTTYTPEKTESKSKESDQAQTLKASVPQARTDDQATLDSLTKAMENVISQIENKSGEGSRNIMFELMATLNLMTRTIQNIAKSQAKSLDLYTKYQQTYTEIMGKFKFKTAKDGPYNQKDKISENLNWASIENQKISADMEMVRMHRDMAGDSAKKIQAEVNQSDEAQKGMLEFMQTLLQKQREWLQAIIR